MPASDNKTHTLEETMSRQEKRANERRRNKILHKITLAAGEGVGRAVAFTFALATNGFAAEPKAAEPKPAEQQKQEEFTLPQVTVTEKKNPYVVPNLGLQRLPEPVQDIPQSITIVPREIINEQAATTLRMRCAMSPASVSPPVKPAALRGTTSLCAASTLATTYTWTACAIKGPISATPSIFKTSKCSKGPASIYFGRGSTGGIINQVSKAPRLEGFYDGTASAGSGPYFRGTTDINQPLGPTMALRLNAMAHHADIVDRDHVKVTRQGFAPTLHPRASAHRPR